MDFPNVFAIHSDNIDVCPELKNYDAITEKVQEVLLSLKKKDVFKSLSGWKNEKFDIR